mmetsp:Transcript_2548/g.5868  ORF Transcript_2548/g.5868 Transcript_2548/m.5868 type:complete len:217 (+) Transcript_2548:2682-3332(+)
MSFSKLEGRAIGAGGFSTSGPISLRPSSPLLFWHAVYSIIRLAIGSSWINGDLITGESISGVDTVSMSDCAYFLVWFVYFGLPGHSFVEDLPLDLLFVKSFDEKSRFEEAPFSKLAERVLVAGLFSLSDSACLRISLPRPTASFTYLATGSSLANGDLIRGESFSGVEHVVSISDDECFLPGGCISFGLSGRSFFRDFALVALVKRFSVVLFDGNR